MSDNLVRLREIKSGGSERKTITIESEDGERREADALELARKKLRLPTLRRAVKRARRGAIYDLELQDGTLIPVGPINHLKDPRKVEDAIAEETGDFPPRYSAAKFRDVARALLAIAELEDSGTAPDDLTLAWLEDYLEQRATRDRDLELPEDRADAAARPDPFTADGRLHVHLPDFERFLRDQRRQPTTARDLGARLARLGFENVEVAEQRTRRGAKVRRRRSWRSPPDFEVTPTGSSGVRL